MDPVLNETWDPLKQNMEKAKILNADFVSILIARPAFENVKSQRSEA